MNQPDGQNKFLWIVIVFGVLFFFAAISMARPARYSRAFYAPSQLNTPGRQMYCIDPGIARPPAGVGQDFSQNQNCQEWLNPDPSWRPGFWNGGYRPPLPPFAPAFYFPTLDFTPVLKALVLLLALAALPLLHGWLLGQAWRYLYPLGEADKALHLARRVSADLMALTIPAAFLYVLHIITNLPFLVGALTVIVVVADIVISVRIARRREFTDMFTRKLAVATGLLSLIVPAGVAGTMLINNGSAVGLVVFMWPVIASLILVFALYRRTLTEYLDRFQALATRWQLDHLAFEILVAFSMILAPVALFFGYAANYLINSPSALSVAFDLLVVSAFLTGGLILLVPFVAMWLVSACVSDYVAWRGRGLSMKKKGSPLELHDAPLFDDKRWLGMLVRRTVLWFCGSIAVSAVLLIAEKLWLQ